MTKILYTSADVRREIVRIFKNTDGRRFAISAFVGEGADAYLPKPKGLKVICWPKAGGTNPNALRNLMKRGVEVMFADSLHMKVYWSENSGVVLTSANLSTSALGSGNLKEMGILLASDELDINHIISSIDPRPASETELQELDRQHKQYIVRNPSERITRGKIRTFEEWFELPMRPEWKPGWFEGYGPLCSIAKEQIKKQHGIGEPENWLSVRKGEYTEGDWILSFKLIGSPTDLRWISVDEVFDVPKSDTEVYNEKYPCQVVQIYPNKRYPTPPFSIREKKFKRAFSKGIRRFGVEKIKMQKTIEPKTGLIDLIYANYKT